MQSDVSVEETPAPAAIHSADDDRRSFRCYVGLPGSITCYPQVWLIRLLVIGGIVLPLWHSPTTSVHICAEPQPLSVAYRFVT